MIVRCSISDLSVFAAPLEIILGNGFAVALSSKLGVQDNYACRIRAGISSSSSAVYGSKYTEEIRQSFDASEKKNPNGRVIDGRPKVLQRISLNNPEYEQ